MEITKNIQVPTGNICIVQGEKGKLEFLSIGDYGKQANIKADFLGIERLEDMLFLLGGVFAVLWGTAVHLGRKADATRVAG